MVRRVHRAVKRPISTASSSRKRKVEEVLKTSKRKKPVDDALESEIESKNFIDISEYDKSNAHESDDVEDSEGRSEGESEEKSKSDSGRGEDKRDIGDGEKDPLSLPICVRDISIVSYSLTTWMDDLDSFPVKIYVRARMTMYREFRQILVEQKLYSDSKKTCFRHLRHMLEQFKFNRQMVYYMLLRRIKNQKKLHEI
ncbi:hypothetical protein P3L10_018389 [Capsicum annuum]